MLGWPRAVLFDFDGVIVNSEPLHFHAFKEVLADEHVELTETEYFQELIGFDDKGAFKYLFQKRGMPLAPKLFLRLMARKSVVMMNLIRRRQFGALPGAEELIRALWRHRPLAICSGALREEIEAMLDAVSLRDCFGVIVAAEDVTVGKPDPSGYLLTMRLVSQRLESHKQKPLNPAECLVIEDAPSVIQSARQAGFVTLGVATSYPAEKLSGANHVVESLRAQDVKRVIPRLPI